MAEKLKFPLVLKLTYPIEYGEELISELHFPMPTVGHVLDVDLEKSSTKDIAALVAKLTEYSPSVIHKMYLGDMYRAAELLGKLLQPSPAT